MRRKIKREPLVPKSAEACRYHEEVFLPRMKALRQQIEAIPLTVLVWGSGESNGELYGHRVEIVNSLRQNNIDANMSEGLVCGTEVWSLRSQEFIQAMAADLIVIFPVSHGSIAELADFSTYKDLARKMIVLLDLHHRGSYIERGSGRDVAAFGQVCYFRSPDDLRSGHVANVVLHKVRQFQMAEWYRKSANG